MRRRHRVFAFFLLLLVCPATAAADTTIGFEDQPDNTVLTTQYAAQGVERFGTTEITGSPTPSPLAVEEVGAAVARAGTKVAAVQRCNSEVCAPTRITMKFVEPHQKVSFTLGGLFGGPTVRVRFFGNAGNQLVQQSVAAASGKFSTPVTYTAAGFDIRYVEIYDDQGRAAMGIDDLILGTPNPNQQPDFSLLPALDADGFASIRVGASRSVPVTVSRVGGSSGPLSFSVADDPRLTGEVVTPTSSSGNSFAVSFAAPKAAEGATVNLKVTATPQSAQAGSQPRSVEIPVRIVPALAITLPTPFKLNACGYGQSEVHVDQPEPFRVPQADPGDGVVQLTSTGQTATVTYEPTTVPWPSSEPRKATVRIKLPPGVTSTPTELIARQEGYADAKLQLGSLALSGVEPTITGAAPARGRTPQLFEPGTEVTLIGTDLCDGAEVYFGNDAAVAVGEASDNNRRLTVEVPRLATTGPIYVQVPGNTVVWRSAKGKEQTFEVDGYRNTRSYPFENPYLDDFTFDDTIRLYGYDQTHYDSVDKALTVGCEVFTLGIADCDVKVAPPALEALIWHAIVDGALSGDPGDAHCFGLAVTSRQFIKGKSSISDYGKGADQVFDLTGPRKKQSKLRRYYRAQHAGQMSAEFINKFLGYFTNAEINTTGEVLNKFHSFMKKGVHPVVAMGEGMKGHVVVAYDVEQAEGVKNKYYVQVWDSNIPYIGDEEKGAKRHKIHKQRMNDSRIVLHPDNTWSYKPRDYGPGEYDGSSHRLMIFNGEELKKQPTLPSGLDGLFHTVFGASAQTESAKGRESVPFSFFDAAPSSGAIFTKGKSAVVRRITADKGGQYTSYSAGAGMSAALTATDARKGELDTLSVKPSDGSFELRTGAARREFEVALSGTKFGKRDRGLVLKGSTSDTIGATLSGSSIVVRSKGNSTITPVLIGEVEKGTAIHKLDSVQLQSGARLEIEPVKWSKPLGAVILRVRGAGPSITKRMPALR